MNLPLGPQLLVVESRHAIRDALRASLAPARFHLEELRDGVTALHRTRRKQFDFIVLNRTLPDLDGITLCRAIRSDGANTSTPILMLVDRETEADKALGLEKGADDCVTTPFDPRELLARVRAILRRSVHTGDLERHRSRTVRRPSIVLDEDRRLALVRGKAVDLTTREFDLLYFLAIRPGIVFSRSALLARLWPSTRSTERTVDTTVSRIRRKIERDVREPEVIVTVWGTGYKFAEIE